MSPVLPPLPPLTPEPIPGGLWVDPLRYVLPAHDADYQKALEFRSLHSHSFPRLDGLFGSIGLCVAFLMLRFLWNNAFAALARWHRGTSSSSSSSGKERHIVLDKVEEEIWVTLGGTLLLVVGWQCLWGVSDFCSLGSTAGCLRNWPLIPVDASTLKYYNLELGWYLHLMLKHVLGLGLQDNGTMGAHHIATVALITLSYMLNIHLVGLMMFALLNLSSPVLHLSKLASSLDMRRTRTAVFAVFALVFLVTRVLMFPYVIVRAAIMEPLTAVRGLLDYFLPFYLLVNALLLVLCVMQCVWFAAVLRILRAALGGSKKELEHVMAERDPAGSGGKLVN